jgi:hypothetical protein
VAAMALVVVRGLAAGVDADALAAMLTDLEGLAPGG